MCEPMEITVAVTRGMELYGLLISESEWLCTKEWVLNEWISVIITLVSYWDCRWIWLEQNGVNFLDVTSQNQMLKCPL